MIAISVPEGLSLSRANAQQTSPSVYLKVSLSHANAQQTSCCCVHRACPAVCRGWAGCGSVGDGGGEGGGEGGDEGGGEGGEGGDCSGEEQRNMTFSDDCA